MKDKFTPATSGQVQIIEQGNITVTRLQQLALEAIHGLFSEQQSNQLPCTVTKGDSWLCVASANDNLCLTIDLTEIRRTDA